MYEVYQDHPKQAKLNVRVVLAIAFLICAIGTASFSLPVWSANRCPRKKPLLKPASYMILLPSRAAGTISARKKLRKS